ncbi:aminotransferase class I/II-fold pyridoxal phosphate-dependent enzyme [Bacteriovoracaceae bacterium]|nr:aminotransferase class I/II-fold pyridoxal phosphate-dependent enzyme [Bacteriovoracaceae bacterium]
MIPHANRVLELRDSIFGEMTKLAKEYNAINLSQGFSEEVVAPELKKYFCEAINEDFNQYAPFTGMPQLIKSVIEYNKKLYDISFDDNNVTITNGATEAIFLIFQSIIDPGDEVLLFEPFYDSYHTSIKFCGGKPVCSTLSYPGFELNFEELEKLVNPKTKAIIFNNPHNPSGKVFSESDLLNLIKFAQRYNLYLISDEVYEFLIFDNNRFIPIQSLQNCYENKKIISISSASKTFDATGWKVGWLIADESLNKLIRRVHQYVTFSVSTPAQIAISRAFINFDSYIQGFINRYQKKLNMICQLLDDIDFEYVRPQGTYFLIGNIKNQSIKSYDLALKLVKEYQLALIPMESFYDRSNEGETLIRFCFAKKDETIISAIKQLGLGLK